MSKLEVGQWVKIADQSLQTYGWMGVVNETETGNKSGEYCIDFADSFGYYSASELEAIERPIAPATEPTAAAQGEGESWGVNPTERELVAYGDGYASGLMDGPEYAPLKNEIIALQAALQQAQRENTRLANEYDRGWKGATESMLSIIERTLENPAGDKLTHIETLLKHFRIDYPKAASAQQAAQPADGEG